jgi:hypothetical protein
MRYAGERQWVIFSEGQDIRSVFSATPKAAPSLARWDVDGGDDNFDQVAVITDHMNVQVCIVIAPRDEHPAALGITLDELACQYGVDDVFGSNALFVRFPERMF